MLNFDWALEFKVCLKNRIDAINKIPRKELTLVSFHVGGTVNFLV